jgi:hypothetical protein
MLWGKLQWEKIQWQDLQSKTVGIFKKAAPTPFYIEKMYITNNY